MRPIELNFRPFHILTSSERRSPDLQFAMQRFVLLLALLVAIAATSAVLFIDQIPLGVPGEWTWLRVEWTPETTVAAVFAAGAGFVYVGFSLLGVWRMGRAGTLERAGWLAALVVIAFAWLGVTLDAVPVPHGYSRVPWVLYYPRSSGYFWQARYDVEDAKSFLAGYEELMAEGDYLHIGTHPPGLTLGYFGLLRLCESFPALTDALVEAQPPSLSNAFSILQETSPTRGRTLDDQDVACLWLAALLTQLAAVATCVVLYFLARRHHDRATSWITACLWPLVPAVAVFFPKSDVLYALPAVTAAWLWMTACDRQSPLRALASGVVLWSGMMLSLAFVTVAALLGVMSLWEVGTRMKLTEYGRRPFLSVKVVLLAAIGFLAPTFALTGLADVNLFNVWQLNFTNHGQFYEHNSRTWEAWLKVNPLEFATAVGLPLVVTAFWGIVRMLRFGQLSTARGSAAASLLCVWGLLWLSGKNMGEAARLWILIMPWVALTAASAFSGESDDSSEAPPGTALLAGTVLTFQLAAAIMTILRIDGFHFLELLES